MPRTAPRPPHTESDPYGVRPAPSQVASYGKYSPPRSGWKTAGKILGVVTFLAVAGATGAGLALFQKFGGYKNPLDAIRGVPEALSIMRDPQAQFPGRSRLTLMCVGLDRNIMISRDPTKNGMPYTKGARSDVLMVASLDLASGKVSILSIPRDTRVDLPGRRRPEKINAAHSIGGIPYTRDTVEDFLGVSVDNHVVIKQEAIKAVVDALGGLTVKVDHDMDYDDNWGQLHIHLKEGVHKLNGEQIVGFMRFRHDAEGDFGRIKRQQQVIQALAEEMKRPDIVLKARPVLEAIREYIQTDLSWEQQLALAEIFRKVSVSDVVTTQLPISGIEKFGDVSYVMPDEEMKQYAVDWIVNGNAQAMNRLIRVQLKNASGDRELYQKVYRVLRHSGFQVWRGGRVSGEPIAASYAVQHSNLKGSARRVLESLGVSGNVEKSEKNGPDVVLYVGKNLADNPVLANADLLEELPDILPGSRSPRRSRSSRRRSESTPEASVRIQAVEPEPEPSEPAPEPDTPLDTSGTPQSEPGGSTPPPDQPGTGGKPE